MYMSQVIHMRLDTASHQEIKSFVNAGQFTTQSEFIKIAIRKYLEDLHKQEAYKALTKMCGSVKGKRPNQEERAKVVEEYLKSGRDIFKELGLK